MNKGFYKKERFRVVILGIALMLCILLSFMIGRYSLSLDDVLVAILNRLFHVGFKQKKEIETVLFNVRIPRVLLAALVGGALSCSGASFQGIFQNPMASPDVLGATAGAAFGASLGIVLNGSRGMISLLAFLFSILTVGLAWWISKLSKGRRILTLVLAGMVVKSLFTAGVSFIKLIADPSTKLQQITFWLLGSLSGTTKADTAYAFVFIIAGFIPIFLCRWSINILTLGDDEARALGVEANVVRSVVIIAATIMTAAGVSVSGMIGWVGLVIPHITRKIVGNNFRELIPASMLMGALFLVIVDDLARNLLAVELPIGILTAVIGAPLFVYLLINKGEHS